MSSTFTNTSIIIDPYRTTHSHAGPGQGAQASQSSAFAEDLLPSCQMGVLSSSELGKKHCQTMQLTIDGG